MPFDPTFPASSIFLVSSEFRAQFNGLFDLIQAIPAGPQGLQGIPGTDGVQGPPFAQAIMDAVNTLNPGEQAQATVSFDGTNVHITLSIPRGNDGLAGQDGVDGQDGQNGQDGINGQNGGVGPIGPQGLQGPPFTNIVIDSVTTLPPGDQATAAAVYDGTAVQLSLGIPAGVAGQDGGVGPIGPQGLQGLLGPPFTNIVNNTVTTLPPGDQATAAAVYDGTAVQLSLGIPRGLTGAQGPALAAVVVDSVTTLNPGENATAQSTFDGSTAHLTLGLPRGADGGQGLQGNQGTPGEITAAQLASAINGTSGNSNTVATLDTPFSNDPPTLADLELMRAKMNELVLALRR